MEQTVINARIATITAVTNNATKTQEFLPAVEIRWNTKNGVRRYDVLGDTRVGAPLPIPGLYWEDSWENVKRRSDVNIVQAKSLNKETGWKWWHYHEWLKVPYVRYFPNEEALYIGCRYLHIVRPIKWDKKAPFEKREWQKAMTNLKENKMMNVGTQWERKYSETDDYKKRHLYLDECIVFKDDITQAYKLDGTPYGDKGRYYAKGAAELLKKYWTGSNQFYNNYFFDDDIAKEIYKFMGITGPGTRSFYELFKQESRNIVESKKTGKSSAQIKADKKAKEQEKLDLCNNAQLTDAAVIDKKYPLEITYKHSNSSWSGYRYMEILKTNEWIAEKEGDWVRIIHRTNYGGFTDNGDKATTVKPTIYDVDEKVRIYTGGEKPITYTKWYNGNWDINPNGNCPAYNRGNMVPCGNMGMTPDEAFEATKNPHWHELKKKYPKLYSYKNSWRVKSSEIFGKTVNKPTYKKINKSADMVEACNLDRVRLDFIESVLDTNKNSSSHGLLVLHKVKDMHETYDVLRDLRDRIIDAEAAVGKKNTIWSGWDTVVASLATGKATYDWYVVRNIMNNDIIDKLDNVVAIKNTPAYDKLVEQIVKEVKNAI